MKLANTMLIGLTGNICSGKTTVLNLFKKLGAYTLSADEIVANVYLEDRTKKWLMTHFNTVDKKEIAQKVFKNKEDRILLENFIHPKVWKKALKEIEISQAKIIIFEIPLLFETNWIKKVDFTLLVVGGQKDLSRRISRRNLTLEEYQRRKNTQIEDSEKIIKSDFVIYNNSSLQNLGKKVKELYEGFEVLSQFN